MGLELPQGAVSAMGAFGRALLEKNQVMNLTAITDPEQVGRLHFLDSLTLLDALGKRMVWLGQTLPALGIRARCITARAEEAVAECRESYDFALSRAVARLNVLCELCLPYVKTGGYFLAMKGAAARVEAQEAERAISTLGGQIERIVTFPVDGTEHAVVCIRKARSTPAKYPRRFGKIKQQPL